jgi:acyl transferase domain-containing protein/acyl-CoA synthetase (AMP-forming)/AMP-acid ligase II
MTESLLDILKFRAQHQSEQKAYIFLQDGEIESGCLTYAELDRQARAIAAHLESYRGERALLLYHSGLEFITAFFGCLYAGVIAVPIYPPRRNQNLLRFLSITNDAQAKIALTTASVFRDLKQEWETQPELAEQKLVATDTIVSNFQNFVPRSVEPESLAFLQYTSGSTGTPRGVMVTHGNIIHNQQFIQQTFGHSKDSIGAGWLPLFHDMGLIGNVLQPVFLGFVCVLMPPVAFLQKPVRWLQVISRYKATTSGGPNFAYDLCINRIKPEELAELDLSSWDLAFNGAESVRAATLERFSRKFAACGFRTTAFFPCYGLAESTLLATGGNKKQPPVVQAFSRNELEQNLVVESEGLSQQNQELVGCGSPYTDAAAVVVDPESLTRCETGRVGEIWLSGGSIAAGYWNNAEATQNTFRAYLLDTSEGPFLRTGDLGFLDRGELFITGRLKDVIIVRGRNHYPQDIELTAENSHPALRENASATFMIEVGQEEKLIIVCEVERSYLRKLNIDEIVKAIKIATLADHDLEIHQVVLLKAGSMPKTSSGKIQHSACKTRFLENSLSNVVGEWREPSKQEIEESLPNPQASQLNYRGQSQTESVAEIELWLTSKIAEMQQVRLEDIDSRQPWAVYGLDSVKAVIVAFELSEWMGIPIPPTIVYDYPSIRALAEFLGRSSSAPEQSNFNAYSPVKDDAIAVIGKGCRFPQAANPQAFWSLLRSGRNAITKVPPTRWSSDQDWGGFLEDIDQFDPQFFSISPREASSIDPQQRLLLEVSWEALEDAALVVAELAGTRSGVFIGISGAEYARFSEKLLNRDAYYATGNALSVAANRLSYFLDWHGPSWAVDTACSSSLVAVHQACQSLLMGECHLALAGGVNLMLSPQLTSTFSEAQMMASDGRCKTFDAAADGYVRSEGCGVVVLKRLADAIADGDCIQAIIRGSAINQDGLTNGLTAPNGKSQQDVVRLALAKAGVTPNLISYVETHGTGTTLGDPIEVNSLKAVLMENRRSDQPCWIGSVKTNIGHLESAAGIAGLIKTILSLEHGEIPPHLHLSRLNPYIELEQTPIVIPTQLQSWRLAEVPRLAGVSAFGFGGTNVHVILEEATPFKIQDAQEEQNATNLENRNLFERPLHLLTLSAKTAKSLKDMVYRYQRYLKTHEDLAIADICFSANTGRSQFNNRLSIYVSDRAELADKLLKISAEEEPSGVFSGESLNNSKLPKVAYLFTGQGSQYVNMGRQLYDTQPTFRQALDECATLMQPYLDRSLLSVLYSSDQGSTLIHQTLYAQPALFALEYALYRLWESWGIIPNTLLGHSLGEYVAAVIAGVMSLTDGIKLVTARAKLMQGLPATGEMIAVFAAAHEIQKVVDIDGESISFAAYNSPQNVVISGQPQSIVRVCEALTQAGIKFKELQTSHAFHSALMKPILAEFKHIATAISYRPPQIPLISNLTGKQIGADEINAEYWCQHLSQAVRFNDCLQTLNDLGTDIFLEIGPQPTLISIGQQCCFNREHLWLNSLHSGSTDWTQMIHSLAQLSVAKLPINWEGFDRDYARQRISLPTYPFQQKRYWIDAAPESNAIASPANDRSKTSFLPTFSPSSTDMSELQHQQEILTQLRTLIANLLKIDFVDVDIYTSFLEMGADSLVLVAAIRQIEKTFGLKITIRQIFEDLTNITSLAHYLHEQLSQSISLSPSMTEITAVDITKAQEDNIDRERQFNPTPQQAANPSDDSLQNDSNILERVMQQQLQAMSAVISEQLSVLQHQGVTSNSTTSHTNTNGKKARLESSAKQPNTSFKERPANKAQAAYVKEFIEMYSSRTSKSKDHAQNSRSVLADSRATAGFRPSTKELVYPIIGDRAAGAYFYDIDGNQYIDLTMGFGTLLFGHNPEFVREAINTQIDRGLQIGPQAQLAGEVAQLITNLTGTERVAFCNSGTEAVMTAIRLARNASGRDKIAIFANSYHGHFDGILAQAVDRQGQSVPSVPGVAPSVTSDVLVLEYGDIDALDVLRLHAAELAGVVVEPVQSRNPNLQPHDFLQQLRQLTTDSSIALIFDEVLLGFRIHQGGAQAWFNIQADLVTYGKVVGGSLPIGVVAGKRKYLNGIDGGWWSYGDASYPEDEKTFFAGTFNKNHLGMAAAKAVLQYLQAEGSSLQTKLNQKTDRLVSTLNDFFSQEDVPIKVVHFGSLFRFEFQGNLDLFFYHLIFRGIYIWEGRSCFLSTAHTDEDIDQVIQAVKASVREMRNGGFWSQSSFVQLEHINALGAAAAPTTDKAIGTPLTKAQRNLWTFAKRVDNGSAVFNLSVILKLRGVLNLAVLQKAIQGVVDRHEALRTKIASTGDVQQVLSSLKIDVPIIDFSDVPDDVKEVQVAEWLQKNNQTSFDLTEDLLFQCFVFRLEPEQHLLVVVAHHIIADGWSMRIILQEIGAIYSAECQGAECQLSSPMQFQEYARWLKELLETTTMANHKAYWLERFREPTPELNLLTDYSHSATMTFQASQQTLQLASNVSDALRCLSREQGCTLFTTLLAAYKTLLHQLTGQEDILVGVPTVSRSLVDSETLVGFCAHSLAIRSQVVDGLPFIKYLHTVREVLLEAYEHQDYPLPNLCELLREQHRIRLRLTTVFSMEPVPSILEMSGLDVSFYPPPIDFSFRDLSLNIIEVGSELVVLCRYRTDLFETMTISTILEHFQTVLTEIITNPHRTISTLPLLTSNKP